MSVLSGEQNATLMREKNIIKQLGTTPWCSFIVELPKHHHDYWRSRPPTSQTASR
jgi:hypothetical protein